MGDISNVSAAYKGWESVNRKDSAIGQTEDRSVEEMEIKRGGVLSVQRRQIKTDL